MMNKLLACALLFGAAAPMVAQAPSPARAKVEARLAQLLEPGAKADGPTLPSELPPRKPVASVERPELPQKSTAVPPPAPPKPGPKSVRPRSAAEDIPLVRNFSQPEAPQAVQMPEAALIRLWSPDVNEPVPLPILGTDVKDRASLADPSLEASVAAAQAKLNPVRTQPVPFQAMNLPDPFENAQAVRLRNPPEESPEPPLTLRPLGK